MRMSEKSLIFMYAPPTETENLGNRESRNTCVMRNRVHPRNRVRLGPQAIPLAQITFNRYSL